MSVPRRFSVVLLLILGLGGLLLPSAAAQTEPDLSGVTIDESVLPDGFRLVPNEQLVDVGGSAGQIADALDLEIAELQQYVVYASESSEEIVEAVVVGPLTATERLGLELAMADPAALADSFTPFIVFVDQSTPELLETSGIGESSFGYSVEFTVTSDLATATNILGVEWRQSTFGLVLGLRDDYIFIVATSLAGGGEPEIDLMAMARHVDDRLAVALGHDTSEAFRAEGTFSPGVATHIPALSDVSTEPGVVAANLMLAAAAVILVAIGMGFLNRTLAEHEGALESVLRPATAVRRWYDRADSVIRRRAGRSADLVRVCGILLFYGVVFSFLEDGWRPWTISGLFLLLAMTVAFGLVGTGDDLVEFRAGRRWGLPVRLAVRPALVLIALGSVVLTKAASLVPGLMIGTPEAFSLENEVDSNTRFRLRRLQLLAMTAIGLTAWVLAAPLDAALDGGSGFGQGLLAAAVTVLLLVFAVSVENLFGTLLGFPGSAGESLRNRSRPMWWACLIAVTGLFFHTLINPAGDLAQSLESTNVRVVMATVGVFLAFTLAVWWWFRRRDRGSEPGTGDTHAPAIPADVGSGDRTASVLQMVRPTPAPAAGSAARATTMPTAPLPGRTGVVATRFQRVAFGILPPVLGLMGILAFLGQDGVLYDQGVQERVISVAPSSGDVRVDLVQLAAWGTRDDTRPSGPGQQRERREIVLAPPWAVAWPLATLILLVVCTTKLVPLIRDVGYQASRAYPRLLRRREGIRLLWAPGRLRFGVATSFVVWTGCGTLVLVEFLRIGDEGYDIGVGLYAAMALWGLVFILIGCLWPRHADTVLMDPQGVISRVTTGVPAPVR